jgi:hypothetical protein
MSMIADVDSSAETIIVDQDACLQTAFLDASAESQSSLLLSFHLPVPSDNCVCNPCDKCTNDIVNEVMTNFPEIINMDFNENANTAISSQCVHNTQLVSCECTCFNCDNCIDSEIVRIITNYTDDGKINI